MHHHIASPLPPPPHSCFYSFFSPPTPNGFVLEHRCYASFFFFLFCKGHALPTEERAKRLELNTLSTVVAVISLTVYQRDQATLISLPFLVSSI